MRKTFMAAVALGMGVLAAGPALASGKTPPAPKFHPPKFHPYVPAPGDEIVPIVSPGEEIGIACDALEYTAPDNDVRVVLTISAAPTGDAPAPGYKKVLATNEQLTKGAVHVRIPDTPDLANHTVAVAVYVVNDGQARGCDAGHMHIADRSVQPKGDHS
jgi:hypothetical protein